MDEKFDKWLKYVCEMHAACVEEENDTEKQFLQSINSLAVANEQLNTQQNSAKNTQEAQDLMEAQIKLASKAFKKASDEFPSGYVHIPLERFKDSLSLAGTSLHKILSKISPLLRREPSTSSYRLAIPPLGRGKIKLAKATAPVLPRKQTLQQLWIYKTLHIMQYSWLARTSLACT
jgi:hypothetical protein